MKRKLRVGIIGCGRIAGLLQDDPLRKGVVTHSAAYKAFPDSIEIVACTSRKRSQARTFAQRFGIASYYDDHCAMLREEKLDIVSVCAYADSRYVMIKDAIRYGVRGIFCEKPLATSLIEVDKLIALCKKTNVSLMVNHTRRWGHDYRTVKKMLSSKKFGAVRSVVGYFPGAFFHTGTHMFDIMNYLCGKPLAVAGSVVGKKGTSFEQIKKNKMSFDDRDGCAFIYYPNNVVATVIGVPKRFFMFELDIQTESARIRIGNGLFEVYETDNSGRYTDFKELHRSSVKVDQYELSPLAWAVNDLVRSVRSRRKLVSTAEDARDALEIAFGILESHKQQGLRVRLPLKKRGVRIKAR